MQAEYSRIADAYFKSIETISSFYRYYLLITSLPFSLFAFVSPLGFEITEFNRIFDYFKSPVSFIFLSISLIGVGMFCYIINLHLDSVLYIRVVNGVRKYFYDNFNEDIALKIRLRVLPQSPYLPTFFENSLFLSVVFVFGVMNSLYFLFGGFILGFRNWWFFTAFFSFFIL